ncbi:MAG: Trk system potassium transporter TrkA [Candidatus Endonucleobacter sp. (ex Gigantidas childressi)]|nr:Trk system potassium transporter TrkA [Candidatus Endonucleobacter sp. (ex Gigantidas childressi)]
MKIIILGAGHVGGTLAENLASEENDITVVDTNGNSLRKLQEKIDIRTIQGKASFPSVLKQAGADEADMLVAVTNSDEVNMIACQIAYTMFQTPSKIARIRQSAYLSKRYLFGDDALPIDVLISPEQVVTNNIKRLLERPGALQVLDFANGLAQLVGMKAYYGGPLVGQELRYIREHMPSVDTRVAAIFRRGEAIKPKGTTVIEADDEVFFIADHRHIRAVMSELQRLDDDYKRIVIAGGGNIGLRLAQAIENSYKVKIIEHNMTRCQFLSEALTKAMVFNGSASDKELLVAENIENTDVFCALTNDDEANIIAAMLAKRLGARKVMALVNNPAYVDLVDGGEIDITISPQLLTTSSLLKHVRKGDVVNVYSLRRGAAEAIEAIAHGDRQSSNVVGRTVEQINLPKDTTIGAIVRDEKVLMPHDTTQIEAGDHIILFLTNKKRIKEVEKLFQVGLGYF